MTSMHCAVRGGLVACKGPPDRVVAGDEPGPSARGEESGGREAQSTSNTGIVKDSPQDFGSAQPEVSHMGRGSRTRNNWAARRGGSAEARDGREGGGEGRCAVETGPPPPVAHQPSRLRLRRATNPARDPRRSENPVGRLGAAAR